MDVDLLAAKVRYGYGKAASILGRSTTIYRPDDSTWDAITVNVRPAQFDTVPTFTFTNPQKFGNVTYYALMDVTGLLPGDYLVSEGTTYFVATVDDFAAPMVQRCDAVLTISRPSGSGVPGAGYYSGDVRDAETLLLDRWPAAMVITGRSTTGAAALPADPHFQRWQAMLPVSVPRQIRTSDIVEDSLAMPMRMLISSVEYSALGIRMFADQAVT